MLSDDFYGDRFRWFTGVVKDVGDDRSRVRVRIFGIHQTEDLERVSDGDLPWAMVLYPTTGGQTGGGNASHGLVPGTWVVGFFVDGEDSQQPIVIGVINGGTGSMNNSPGGSGIASTPSDPANIPSDNSSPTTQLTGGTNRQQVYNYFYERISKEAAYTGDIKSIVAALVGNFQVESGCGTSQYNPNDKGQRSVGLAQWRGERIPPFLSFCGVSDVSKGSMPPLEKQLDYVWHELHGPERSAYNKLLTAGTVQDAVAGMIYYERDDSYQKVGGHWTVNRDAKSYKSKLEQARSVMSSLSYTGSSV
jgi:hypothetical protein